MRQHRIITKIYGGANARPVLLRLLIPPGRNVLGYRTKNSIQKNFIKFKLDTCTVVDIFQ